MNKSSGRKRSGRVAERADVYQGFPGQLAICAVSSPRAPAPRFCAYLPARRPDYLHFANGAFAGCSIPDPRRRTYRSGVG
ncbi:hypothetical protein BLAT2472_40135 [Burkholderia latens]